MNVLRFWGKTSRTGVEGSRLSDDIPRWPAYKPVLHHMLDVAAAARAWLAARPALVSREADLLGVDASRLIGTTAFLAGLHDLGKISRSFQAKREDLWPHDVLGPAKPCCERAHWRNTALLLRAGPITEAFARLFPGLDDPGALSPLIAAVAGHHGRPPRDEETNAKPSKAAGDPELGPECIDAAARAFDALTELLSPQPLVGLDHRKAAAAWSWRLSGLVTLADWIGSDADHFYFQPLDTSLADYWAWAQGRADEALWAKGLAPPAPFPAPTLRRVAPEAADRPRPMQALADRLDLAPGPQLIIVEDTTGAGKTEAALALAARMMAAGKGEGVFFALPTMATANAMHSRLAKAYRTLFEDGREPSLMLAHGRAGLSTPFRATVGTPMSNGGELRETAAAFCAQWLADSRKTAFFADVGAATIDQAFLAVLPKKHLTLRQVGLAGRILVVDEAHCFDAYMKEELSTLLQLQAMNGGSAIVLSATLTQKQKREMTEAFGTGIGLRDPEDLGECIRSEAYPLLTRVTPTGVAECAPGFDPRLRRSVAVERLESRTRAVERAIEAAGKGAAVAVICNAVDEAIDSFAAIRAAIGDRAHLFHARFAQTDRQAIEAATLARFGKTARPEERAGHVLVATQVIEQSLDLDFDLVISDLAPIDLLIQRAGRLWRHMTERPEDRRPVGGPTLLVISPDPNSVESDDWLGVVLGKAAAVYGDAGILWRTAREVFAVGAIRTPDSFRPMIEAVYREDGRSDVPAPLQRKMGKAQGEAAGAKSLGRWNVVALDAGYGGLSDSLSGDEDIGTRLGAPTVTLRLARRQGGRLVPWALADDSVAAWALSEVRVRTSWLGASLPIPDDRLRKAAKADWPEWEVGLPIAVVADDETAQLYEGQSVELTYDLEAGLRRRSPSARG